MAGDGRGWGVRKLLSDFVLFFNTVRYLRPPQIFGRLRLFFPRQFDRSAAIPVLRKANNRFVEPVRKCSTMTGAERFRFLNEERSISTRQDWNVHEASALWQYNLHYFEDLVANDFGSRTDWHTALIENWILACPPTDCIGWDPYPTSIRIINWIKRDLGTPILTKTSRNSLFLQARWLCQNIEYHLLGNHLWMNGKALLFAGLYFQGDEAGQWSVRAWRILKGQLIEQVLEDGGHYERSAMYHSLFIEDILDVINITRVYGISVDKIWLDRARSMLNWLSAMSHPDGEIVLFNDAAIGIAGKHHELVRYSERLGIKLNYLSDQTYQMLPDTGYARLNLGDYSLFIDVAPLGPDYQPAHGHADTLGFELSVRGQRVFVDSGTSCYGISAERLRQRGTAAHNTISIDGMNSSEVWSGFRVARRARVSHIQAHEQGSQMAISAMHNGYSRLTGKPTHKRTWEATPDKIVVTDEILGTGSHEIQLFLHCHPDIESISENEKGALIGLPGEAGGYIRVEFDNVQSWQVKDSTYHPEFGVSYMAKKLVARVSGQLPMQLRTNLVWCSDETKAPH